MVQARSIAAPRRARPRRRHSAADRRRVARPPLAARPSDETRSLAATVTAAMEVSIPNTKLYLKKHPVLFRRTVIFYCVTFHCSIEFPVTFLFGYEFLW